MDKLSDRVYYPNLAVRLPKVLMETGYYKPLPEVLPGETLYGGNHVLSNRSFKIDLIEIETNLGHIRVPFTHQFVLNNGSIKRAGDLEATDIIAPAAAPLEERKTGLTDAELKFFGAWLSNGIIKKNMSIGFRFRDSSALNKIKPGIHMRKDSTLNTTEHSELSRLILSLDHGVPLLEFGSEEYKSIYDGYLCAGKHKVRGKISSLIKRKDVGLFIQYCAILNEKIFKIGNLEKRILGYFGESPAQLGLAESTRKQPAPAGSVISIQTVGEGLFYDLQVDGDHRYVADNLCCYGNK